MFSARRWLPLLALLCACAAARAEIPQHPDATLEKDYKRAYSVSYQQLLRYTYAQDPSRDTQWDGKVDVLITQYGKYWAYAGKDERMMRRAAAVLDAGCKEPMVRYFHAMAGLKAQGPRDALVEELQQAEAAFSQRNYPAVLRYECNVALWDHYHGKDAERAAKHRDAAGDYFVQMLADATGDSADLEPLFRAPSDYVLSVAQRQGGDAAVALAERVRTCMGIDPALRAYYVGLCYVEAAWAARGRGPRSAIPPQRHTLFRNRLFFARMQVADAYHLRPDLPEAATLMMRISRSLVMSQQITRAWFELAVQARFDYIPAYSQMLIQLRPRWRGSEEQMYAFGLECMQTERYDTHVPWELVDALEEICYDDWSNPAGYGSPAFWRDKGVYDNLRRVLEGYMARWESMRDNYRTRLAAFAYLCGRNDEVARLLDELGDNVQLKPLAWENVTLEQLQLAVALERSPMAPQFVEARRLADIGELDQALEVCSRLLQMQVNPPVLRRAIATQAQALRWAQAFETGRPVELKAIASLVGWERQTGDWSALPDGSFAASGTQAEARLYCTGRFGGDWELAGTVRIDTADRPAPTVGIVLARNRNNLQWPVLLIKPRKEQVELATMKYYAKAQYTAPVKLRAANITFRVRREGDRVSAWIDGQKVFDRRTIDGLDGADQWVGLYADKCSRPQRVTFAHLRIQRLPPPGPPPAPW